jgi:hypothetical protein
MAWTSFGGSKALRGLEEEKPFANTASVLLLLASLVHV